MNPGARLHWRYAVAHHLGAILLAPQMTSFRRRIGGQRIHRVRWCRFAAGVNDHDDATAIRNGSMAPFLYCRNDGLRRVLGTSADEFSRTVAACASLPFLAPAPVLSPIW